MEYNQAVDRQGTSSDYANGSPIPTFHGEQIQS